MHFNHLQPTDPSGSSKSFVDFFGEALDKFQYDPIRTSWHGYIYIYIEPTVTPFLDHPGGSPYELPGFDPHHTQTVSAAPYRRGRGRWRVTGCPRR